MKQRERMSIPERLGRWTGRAWRAYVRRETSVLQWLRSKGIPALLAKTALWAVKLTVLGVLLYAMFWLTLIIVFAILAAMTFRSASPSEEGEWRNGQEGHGYYRDGKRVDYGRLFDQDE